MYIVFKSDENATAYTVSTFRGAVSPTAIRVNSLKELLALADGCDLFIDDVLYVEPALMDDEAVVALINATLTRRIKPSSFVKGKAL